MFHYALKYKNIVKPICSWQLMRLLSTYVQLLRVNTKSICLIWWKVSFLFISFVQTPAIEDLSPCSHWRMDGSGLGNLGALCIDIQAYAFGQAWGLPLLLPAWAPPTIGTGLPFALCSLFHSMDVQLFLEHHCWWCWGESWPPPLGGGYLGLFWLLRAE